MFCMNCGTQLPDDAKFCFKCGKQIGNPAGDPAPVPAAPQAAPVNVIPERLITFLKECMPDAINSIKSMVIGGAKTAISLNAPNVEYAKYAINELLDEIKKAIPDINIVSQKSEGLQFLILADLFYSDTDSGLQICTQNVTSPTKDSVVFNKSITIDPSMKKTPYQYVQQKPLLSLDITNKLKEFCVSKGWYVYLRLSIFGELCPLLLIGEKTVVITKEVFSLSSAAFVEEKLLQASEKIASHYKTIKKFGHPQEITVIPVAFACLPDNTLVNKKQLGEKNIPLLNYGEEFKDFIEKLGQQKKASTELTDKIALSVLSIVDPNPEQGAKKK